MFKTKQYNYIFLLVAFFLQVNICCACNVTFSVDKTAPSCTGDTDGKIIITVIDGTAPFVYSFDGGSTFSTENFRSNLSAGDYDVVVEDADGCERTKSVYLSEPSPLMVDLGEDILVEMGDEVELSAQVVGAFNTISWSSTDPDNPLDNQHDFDLGYIPLSSHTIYVYVVRDNCIVSDSIFVTVERSSDDIFIPNAFTPNGDGNNDRFNVYGGKSVAKVIQFQVLDNWGSVVFETSNFSPQSQSYDEGWDGTIKNQRMNPNAYLYFVEVEYLDGATKTFFGDVLLIR